MIKNIQWLLCCMLFSLCGLVAQVDETPWQTTNALDLSQSHAVGALLNSDLVYWEEQGRQIGRVFILNQQNLKIKFPGGRSIQQKIELGDIQFEDGKLTTLGVNGLCMPIKECYEAAKQFHVSLGLDAKKLNRWYVDNKDDAGGARMDKDNTYLISTKNCYPCVSIEIRKTVNPLYPWFIRMSMGWNITRRSKGRDEKWGRENNPVPPEGYTHISLDAPSGRIYDLKEAWKHLEESKRKTLPRNGGRPTPENAKVFKRNPQVDSGGSKGDEAESRTLIVAGFLSMLAVVLMCAWVVFRKKDNAENRKI